MKIDKILKNKNIPYKVQEYDDYINIYKVGNSKLINIVTMIEKGNVFKIDSDLFYYLNNQKEPYSFLLIDRLENKFYYLDFKNKNNWIKSSFERSGKDEIYFGKIVLNNRITKDKVTSILYQYID
ncbi:hypothetical protein [Paraclostridium bifermentans]|uniref:hypothetical protein n=1 Tax=Paraclostridium bifermentans TaxID=1490 RepID=UPI00359C33BC